MEPGIGKLDQRIIKPGFIRKSRLPDFKNDPEVIELTEA